MEYNVESVIQELIRTSNDYLKLIKTIESSKFENEKRNVEKEVFSLLDISKPKIMMCGIYNAGKSTLINSIIGKEIAQMADKPETAVITEYDNGDYILIDSPGIDAPIEHERITKEYISKCHIIFFVISNKGTFESSKNYEEMYNIIKLDKPFVIIINDKAGVEENANEIIEIKNKIIKNLNEISGEKNLAERYEILFVNAKRALRGVIENKKVFYEKSNIKIIKNKINNILQKNNALNILDIPMKNLIDIITRMETYETKKIINYSDERYMLQIENVNKKRSNLLNDLKINIRGIVESFEEQMIDVNINNDLNKKQRIEEEIIEEIKQFYELKISEISRYINESFPDLRIKIDRKCTNVEFENEVQNNELKEIAADTSKKSENTIGISAKSEEGNTSKFNLANLSKVLLNLAEPSDGDYGMLGILLNFFKDKEEEKYKKLLAEAEVKNQYSRTIALEQAGQKQQIRSEVQNNMFEFQWQITKEITKQLGEQFNQIINTINDKVFENVEKFNEIKNMLRELQDLKGRIEVIRNNIY